MDGRSRSIGLDGCMKRNNGGKLREKGGKLRGGDERGISKVFEFLV